MSTGTGRSCRRRTNALATALTLVLLTGTVAACTGSPAPSPSGTERTAGPDGGEVPDRTPAPAATVTPAPTLDAVAPTTLSTSPRSVTSDATGQLTSVTVVGGPTADQIRFTFTDGPLPGYEIRYLDAMVRGDDDVVLLAGSAVLAVTFTSSTPGPDGTTAPDVITNATFDLTTVRQVVLVTNLGGTLTFGVGAGTQVPFTVTVDGSTLLVDLLHP